MLDNLAGEFSGEIVSSAQRTLSIVASAKQKEASRSAFSIPVLLGLCRAADMLLLATPAIAFGAAMYLFGDKSHLGEHAVIWAIAIATAAIILRRQNTYTLAALMDPLGQVPRIAGAVAIAGVVALSALVLLRNGDALPPGAFEAPLTWAAASGACLLASRSLISWRLQVSSRRGRLARRIAIIGANAFSLKFLQDARSDAMVDIVGIYDDRKTRLPAWDASLSVAGTVRELVQEAGRKPIDAIVIAMPLNASERIAEVRAQLAGLCSDIYLTTDVAGLSYSGAQFTTLGNSPVVAVASRPLKDWQAFKKAALDRVMSALLLSTALPLMTIIAVLVKLDSPGPVLFRQAREGLNGRPFTMFKFRTMRHDRGTDQSVQATRGDPRVTRIGNILRRTSLDELPQLLNVLRGEMSLVGPRPHLATTRIGSRMFPEIVPGYQARHRMKPGLTGWAQVQGFRGETKTERDLAERVRHDLFYIENWSLAFDLRIIVRTILREIISSSGKAY